MDCIVLGLIATVIVLYNLHTYINEWILRPEYFEPLVPIVSYS